MTTRPTVSSAGLDAMKTTRRGEISRESGPNALDFAWRTGGSWGHSVTNTVEALQRRGLVEEAAPVLIDGEQRTLLILTDAGRTLLDDLTSRAPNGGA